MMRSKLISEEIKKRLNNIDIKTEEGRQILMVAALNDIDQTFAMLFDVYAMCHGIDMRSRKEKSDD